MFFFFFLFNETVRFRKFFVNLCTTLFLFQFFFIDIFEFILLCNYVICCSYLNIIINVIYFCSLINLKNQEKQIYCVFLV